MNAVERPKESQSEGSTLGDLLRANSRPAPSEADWVALVRAVRDGDQQAFRALYQRCHRIVFTLSIRILGDKCAAEEVTLDVFHNVWRHAGEYDVSGGPVLGWILNQARSRAIDRIRFEHRKKRCTAFTNGDGGVESADAGEESLDREQRARHLRQALTALQPTERAAIESAFFGDRTYVEVASQLNEPLGTIKTRIRSGLQKLRSALCDELIKP